MVPMEPLPSPVSTERETEPQSHAASGQDARAVVSDQCVEASPLHSDPEDAPLVCSSPERPAPTSFSPQIALPGPESSVPQITAPQPRIEPQVQYQVPHQLQVSQALFTQNQLSVSQPPPQLQVQVQSSVSPPLSSVHSSTPPLRVSVPQQQPDPSAASACLSKGGDDSAVQQHTQNSE